MGLAYTIDSPIKVAKYGISSVISIVDDFLAEKMNEFYFLSFRGGSPCRRAPTVESPARHSPCSRLRAESYPVMGARGTASSSQGPSPASPPGDTVRD